MNKLVLDARGLVDWEKSSGIAWEDRVNGRVHFTDGTEDKVCPTYPTPDPKIKKKPESSSPQ